VNDAVLAFIQSLERELEAARQQSDKLDIAAYVSSFEAQVQSKLHERLVEWGTKRWGDSTTLEPVASPAGGNGAGGGLAPTTALPAPDSHGGLDSTTDAVGAVAAVPMSRAVKYGLPPNYRYLGPSWKGGMGIVHKALHVPLKRTVALKMILAGDHASPEQIARFKKEAAAAARLSHPNIVPIYEVGSHRGLPYFALEFIDGVSLDERLKKTSLSGRESAEVMVQVARAMHYSHGQGVIHRDLKPKNIMLAADDTPQVTDFGLAKDLADDGSLSLTGQILGTPSFMPPEQARGEEVDKQFDVYAMGATLYCLLTGRPPFVGPTVTETIRQVVHDDPVPPSRLQPNLSRDLEAICLKCLEKEPERRYASAQDLADDLQRFIEDRPTLARPITLRQRAWKWCRRNPRVAALSALAASLLLVLLAGGYVAAAVINRQKAAEAAARKQAEDNQELAEEQADLALDATRVLLYETQEYFKGKPEYGELRKNMLAGILKEIDRVYASHLDYDAKEVFRASAIRQLGEIYMEAEEFQKALERFQESEGIALQLVVAGTLPQPDLNLGTLDLWIGRTQDKLGNHEEAESRYLNALAHRKQYFADHPQIKLLTAAQGLADVQGRLGDLYRRQNRPNEALPLLTQDLAARRAWNAAYPHSLETMEELSGALSRLSFLYKLQGRFADAITTSEESVALRRRVADARAGYSTAYNLALIQRQLAELVLALGDLARTETLLEESKATYERLLSEYPNDYDCLAQAAHIYYLLGRVQSQQQRDAAAAFQRGLELQRQALEKSPRHMVLHHRGTLLKLLASADEREEAQILAAKFDKERQKSYYHSLYAAIGYGLMSRHAEGQQKQDLLNKALDCVRFAVTEQKFREFTPLRTDLDFAPLQELPEYREFLDAAEAK